MPPETNVKQPDKPWSPLRGVLLAAVVGVIGIAVMITLHTASPGYKAFQRGGNYFVQGQYTNASAEYTNALRSYPEDTASYKGRGNAYARLGQYQKAIDDYTKCIKLMDSEQYQRPALKSQVLYERAIAYTKLGQFDLAAKD